MTHAEDCGIHCRCTCRDCLRRDPKQPRVARCICQNCWLNRDHVPPVKALENPVRPTHTTHRHLPNLKDVRDPMPHGEGFCPRCIRTMPLNLLVGGDSDTVLPGHVTGNPGANRQHCPGSGQPPAPMPIRGEVDFRIRDMQKPPPPQRLPNGGDQLNPIARAYGLTPEDLDQMTSGVVEGPSLPDRGE